ncbi:PREDICTED: BTB and MATH domain-containing protein 43-like [Rhagoletis zephyria]|uniref:BTB and MATH domain-containing protein 43-like n=1 Tax=Rhagoletis zephyria TaxID=28612 RepID=UPI000811790D|nr:PREDICTED: BTB and MATH domain-containing protein 43-like [Rhagoletis zephyria]
MAELPANDTMPSYRQKMQSMLESGRFSDFTLVVGPPGQEQKEFNVYRVHLSACSPVFNAMFSNANTKEVLEKRAIIEDVSAATMRRMLTYFYTGELKYDLETEKEGPLFELLYAADKYQVNLLKAQCEMLLGNLITVNSVFTTLQYAELHNALTLKERCLDFIVNNSDRVVSRDTESAWAQFEAAARPELLKDIFYRMAKKKVNQTSIVENSNAISESVSQVEELDSLTGPILLSFLHRVA